MEGKQEIVKVTIYKAGDKTNGGGQTSDLSVSLDIF